MKKLTKEKVLSIPDLLKEHGLKETALILGVHTVTVLKWARELRSRGIEVPHGKRGGTKILP